MQQYSRMNGIRDDKDHRVRGGNPCLEQSLESYELWYSCCFPHRQLSRGDVPPQTSIVGRLSRDVKVCVFVCQDSNAGKDSLGGNERG